MTLVDDERLEGALIYSTNFVEHGLLLDIVGEEEIFLYFCNFFSLV